MAGERGKGRGGGGFYTPLTQNITIEALRKSGVSGINPDTPASQGQHPRKDPRECVCTKVSLIGFVSATRAPVRLLEDTIPVPLDSTAFL
jgi:hypothetical protein